MRKLLTISLWLLLSSLSAQSYTGDSVHYLTIKDTIFLQIGEYDQKIFEHTIAPKQTLYSLAKFYGLEVADLTFYNPGIQFQKLSAGQRIKIPIPNRAIMRFKTADYRPWTHIPVYYIVRRGDTFFRIAKVYFKMDVEELRIRNGLPNTSVKEGQYIHVGWMNIQGVPEEMREIVGSPLQRENFMLRKQYLRNAASQREQWQAGKAHWKKNNDKDAGLLVLHKEAPINSVISITNPDNNITFYAKVIGRLPEIYDKNVIVVASPTIARALGAVDEEFFVRINYLK